jgi:hypothetical protein
MVNVPLTTEQMVVAVETFQAAYEQVMSKYAGDGKKSILEFVTNIVVLQKPYMLASAKGPEEWTNIIFGNEGARDFILSLSFSFFSRFHETNTPELALAASLTRGLILNSFLPKSFIPEIIVSGYFGIKETEELLGSNQWLMTVLMLQLCITPTVG